MRAALIPSIRIAFFSALLPALLPAFFSALLFASLTASAAGDAHGEGADSVTMHHRTPDRSGQYVVPGLTWQRAAHLQRDTGFDGKIEGAVNAQPLYWHSADTGAGAQSNGLLIVATETNAVYALDATTGRTVWRTALGPAVPRSAMPCGNIDPLGVTGTPVIDAASGTLYLDAMVLREGQPRHFVFGLSLRDGAVQKGWPLDMEAALKARGVAFTSRAQNQRSALALMDGQLFVPYGGNWGDCGDYRGMVVSVRLDHPGVANVWATRAAKGGIWAPGGIAAADGQLFVSTGNTEGTRTWGDGEAVIRLRPDLRHSADSRDFFAPADWKQLDDADLDLSGVNPVPIDLHGRKLIVALGKDGKAYLLDRENLGGIGGALDVARVSSSSMRTAPASWATADGVFIAFQGAGSACPSGEAGAGLTVLRVASASRGGIGTAWCAALDGAGSPITTTSDGNADRIVWVVGAEGDERVHGFRADNGEPVFTGGSAQERVPGVRHFATMLAANQRLYVAGDGRVYAFKAGQ